MLTMSGVERRTALRALAGTAAACLPVVGACAERERPREMLRIATGSRGAVYYRLGTGIAQVVREQYQWLQPEVLITAASTANVDLVNAGKAEVGFTQADVLVETGLAPPLALARLHDDYLHLVVRADSRLRSLSQLQGRRVSLGVP
jgi:hypothetical protein